MNKVGTDTRKSPQRLLQNNVQPALFILTLPLGNTLYLLLSIYSSITLCLNQRFKDKFSFLSWLEDNAHSDHPRILPFLVQNNICKQLNALNKKKAISSKSPFYYLLYFKDYLKVNLNPKLKRPASKFELSERFHQG